LLEFDLCNYVNHQRSLSASLVSRALAAWRHGFAFVLLVISSFVISAAVAETTPDRHIEIRFWTMQLSPFHDGYIRRVIADFEREQPSIRVHWVDVPWAEMEKKTLTAVAAATPKRPAPDVVNLNPQFASKLAEFGALADPAEYLSSDQISRYLPAAWAANQLNGRVFALPWYLTTSIVLYNKTLLARAAVTVPATTEALVNAARQIRSRTGSYAYFPAIDGSTPLENLVSMGAPLLSADGCRAGFIDARGERVLRFYQTLYQEGLVPKNVVTEGHRKSVEMFLSGQIAMVTTGMQFLQYIKTSNPRFYRDVGVAAQMGKDESAPNIAAMNVAVMEKSPHKNAAFLFASYLTNAANQVEFAKRVPILPSTTASYDDAFFSTPTDDNLLNAARQISVAQVKSGRVLVPPMRNYNKFRSDYARNLQAVMLNRKSVTEALADTDRVWTQLLDCRSPARPVIAAQAAP
jgi:putative chitobiose transport system substrate-binding protein